MTTLDHCEWCNSTLETAWSSRVQTMLCQECREVLMRLTLLEIAETFK